MHTPTYDNGWVSQQLIKLQAHQLFSDQYVVLDSTNIILKSFVEWPVLHNRHFPDLSHSFYKFYKSAYKLLGFKRDQQITYPTTPFMFDCLQVNNMLAFWSSWSEFEKWFCSFSYPSEFWLYDLWLNRQGITSHYNEPYKPIPLLEFFTWECWQRYQQNPQRGFYNVAGIVSSVWNNPQFPRNEFLELNLR
jgi:hypothetical protein